MKKLMTVVLCALVVGLVGCSTQKNPDRTAERDYTVSTADKRPACPGGKFGKFGDECPTGDTYK